MALYIGGTKVGANGVYVGGTKASAVYLGSTKAWPDFNPILLEYPTPGTYSYTIPAGASMLDIIGLGPGGGGDSGGAGNRVGKGGGAGSWQHYVRAVTPGEVVNIRVGAGGKGGYGTITGTPPTPGEQNLWAMNAPPQSDMGAAGQQGNLSGASLVQQGASPSPTTYTVNGRTYGPAGTGGAGGNPAQAGGLGAGGGGGNGVITGFSTGGNGGPGKIWLYIY